ncbi:MAG: hypothetical protein H0S80_14500 [Desulfovibrionaceae bacterium]|nr:hypothetical protein [Desulfovibrionaceae bacterium]
MLYVPIKIYPNRRSVRGCILLAAVFLGLAAAGFHFLENRNLRLAVYCISMAGFGVAVINAIAVVTRQPMIKILDDRFSVYTPFGSAVIRFGEVLAFKKGRAPLLSTMRVVINGSARPKFPSGLGKLLYSVAYLNFGNSISIHGFMLGANPDAVMEMLEKRRLAAVRMEAVGDYDPQALTTAG